MESNLQTKNTTEPSKLKDPHIIIPLMCILVGSIVIEACICISIPSGRDSFSFEVFKK